MDKTIAKGLSDKLYEKRKATALQLEKLVKTCVQEGDYTRIDGIIGELCRDYAYALHQPMARNAGLMGLAATAIALGTNDVSKYLRSILPPVLACFGDQNDQVRFYACESLYNIAKIAKGEILLHFNEIFDVLCKISADTENSVRGAAELLDRLIKDIVAERASNYVAIVNNDPHDVPLATRSDSLTGNVYQESYKQDNNLAFSLPKFIPLLTERIYAINPDTRVFLVDWIKVLLNAPGLELISFLPSFLGGLFVFLGDSHKDVRNVTHALIDLLLHEIKRISALKEELRKQHNDQLKLLEEKNEAPAKKEDGMLIAEKKKSLISAFGELSMENTPVAQETVNFDAGSHPPSITAAREMTLKEDLRNGEEYTPGQDVHLNFPEIIRILVNNLTSSEPEIQSLSLHWMSSILAISPNDFLPFFPKILSSLMNLLSEPNTHITELAQTVNKRLLLLCTEYVKSTKDKPIAYGSIVNNLTLQFFDSKVETKIACLDWLSLIYNKAPDEILEHNDSMFLTLLKSLSDKDSKLIEKAMGFLKSLCSASNDNYLRKFLEEFLNLLRRDSRLLKDRANNIVRKVCTSLPPERVFKVISSILSSYDDITFVRMMIQILSTNLLISPEMFSLRRKLRCADDMMFFNLLFKSWCHNPISVISLCLVSENYELAYSVIQAYANFDLKLNDLLQLDVLVQLFESPVFTRMRLQLLEPQNHPFLYKCLYGLLMILPQSKAFDSLNKRLTSVNIWASQPVYPGTYHKARNISGSLSDPDVSQRSVSQSKLHVQELIDYFTMIVSASVPESAYVNYTESVLPYFGNTYNTQEDYSIQSVNPVKSQFIPELEKSTESAQFLEQPTDSGSAKFRTSSLLSNDREITDSIG
ncbi:hypothetical protein KAFR_0A06010 [Kazachstania africana CBS 2517]|uniref:Vacuolar protein 14 C-terminal Fig4-binding domain-containing protein n=1 Tax=Kazachstania africana (strain ATCC 22294 / BCRC 22015 / CBS 2517 / CECT 1963 / NBRC 1671 / NRRL Y-8276) TaxID=1071382 RepID=H2ANT6_KAZAF|nr:hypothetical protein KAFR_0A06010 [Kazachstania africana CBS 2517]CCF56036.1 hypothetical protein KAFR_0A06010 [Kazachstania africana CBS 2517]